MTRLAVVTVAIVAGLLGVTRTALAQPAADRQPPATVGQPPAPTMHVAWTLALGAERLELRDIARTGRPMDGSPSTFEGHGPWTVGRWDRSRRSVLQRVAFAAATSSAFAYVVPGARSRRPGGDRVTWFDAHAELRAYPFRDVMVRGMDIGVGARLLLGHRLVSRHFDPDVEFSRRETDAGLGGTVAVRLTRWRGAVDATWTPALAFSRSRQSHGAGAGVSGGYWGGSVGSAAAVEARVRLAGRLAVWAARTWDDRWRLAAHHTYAVQTRGWLIGVTHGS
jgi:hypothetical protein